MKMNECCEPLSHLIRLCKGKFNPTHAHAHRLSVLQLGVLLSQQQLVLGAIINGALSSVTFLIGYPLSSSTDRLLRHNQHHQNLTHIDVLRTRRRSVGIRHWPQPLSPLFHRRRIVIIAIIAFPPPSFHPISSSSPRRGVNRYVAAVA